MLIMFESISISLNNQRRAAEKIMLDPGSFTAPIVSTLQPLPAHISLPIGGVSRLPTAQCCAHRQGHTPTN